MGARASYQPCSPEGMGVSKSAWGGRRSGQMNQGAKVQSQTLGVKDLGTPREGTVGAGECEFLGSWSQCLDSFLLSPSR